MGRLLVGGIASAQSAADGPLVRKLVGSSEARTQSCAITIGARNAGSILRVPILLVSDPQISGKSEVGRRLVRFRTGSMTAGDGEEKGNKQSGALKRAPDETKIRANAWGGEHRVGSRATPLGAAGWGVDYWRQA